MVQREKVDLVNRLPQLIYKAAEDGVSLKKGTCNLTLIIVRTLRNKLEQFMNYKAIFCIVVFLMLSGCAAQEESVSTRDPKSLITKDDYEDLKVKPRKEKPVEADYSKGKSISSINTMPKTDPKKVMQDKFLYIASFGSVDELKIRYENGGKVNFRNVDGETALIKVLEGSYDNQTLLKLKFLISVGAEVNFKGKGATSERTTPLDAAVWNTSAVFRSDTTSKKPYFAEQVLKFLIDEGAYVSAGDEQGRAPLHIAAQSNNMFAAGLLLESGADVMQKDFDKKTPLDFAESREMKKFLKEHGAVEIKGATPEDALLHEGIRKDANEQGIKPQEEWEPFRDIKPF